MMMTFTGIGTLSSALNGVRGRAFAAEVVS